MALAATPTGSWVAWLGTDERVHLGRLDCDDRLVGKPTSFEGVDLARSALAFGRAREVLETYVRRSQELADG